MFIRILPSRSLFLVNKAISIFLVVSLFSNLAIADCKWSMGVTPSPDGTYKYSSECHLRVGNMIEDIATKDKQIADYEGAITLKDLAIQKSDERTMLWMDTSGKMQDRLTKIDETVKHNEWLYFGLGALTVLGAGFMAARLLGR
jgi:hypothetical protein